MDNKSLGFDFKFEHRNADGEILWESDWLPNHFTDDGIELMFDEFFRGADAPTKFMIGLNTANLSQTSSYTDLVEPTGTGYELKDITRNNTGFPTLALDNNNMQIITAEVTFENTDSTAWTGVTDGFLAADLTSNVLVNYRPLSATRTLQPGDTLSVTIQMKGLQPA